MGSGTAPALSTNAIHTGRGTARTTIVPRIVDKLERQREATGINHIVVRDPTCSPPSSPPWRIGDPARA
ncbi:MAG TPA: hypothetical protein VKD21_02690 [Acidimicrobiales bacterium]|nr:hypothetical protein [Acidimicrobiales bacterium]